MGHRMRLFSPQDYSRYHKLPQDSDNYGGNAIGCHLKIAGTDSVVICHVDDQTRVPLQQIVGSIPEKARLVLAVKPKVF